MSQGAPEPAALRREIARLAAPSPTLQERADDMLQRLADILPFDAGWLAVRDPEHHRHVPVATNGRAEPLVGCFRRREADEEVELLGLNRRRPPMLASDIPTAGRHVGSRRLLSGDPSRPSEAERKIVARVTTAMDVPDRTQDIADTVRLVEGARAGVVLTRARHVLSLPGLPDDRLLAAGSPVLTVAEQELTNGGPFTTFLAPAEDRARVPLVRVTALDVAQPDVDHLSAAVLLSPPGDLHGLSPLDLRVLGLLIEGVTDIQAIAQSLRISTEVADEALGRGLVALRTSDVTTAAVRAVRAGLRIPPGFCRKSP